MAKTKKEEYERAKNLLQNEEQVTEQDRQLIMEFLFANHPDRHTYQMPDGKTKSYSTLGQYTTSLRQVARDLDTSLAETKAFEINVLMDDYINGDIDTVKQGGITTGSARNYQGAVRRFYKYHTDLGVEPEEIHFADQNPIGVDERDLFTPQEVETIRKEAKRRGTRNACIVDMLLYTGQRRSALLNLRVKDVKPEEGVFYLNEEAGELKGASGKRPLLTAQKSVRDWKQQHPTGEPDDYFITTVRGSSPQTDAGDKFSPSGLRGQLERIKEATGISKPMNPHQFRHYFVTVCKRDYGLDDATIKHLIGHDADSTVMELVYQHLTDEDYIQDAEEKFGIREPEEDSPFTPSQCGVCNEPLEKNWAACPNCGQVFSPEAYQTQQQIDEDMWNEKSDAEPGGEVSEAVDDLRNLLKEKPELVDDLLNQSE